MAVSQDTILLQRSLRKNAVIYPQSKQQFQRVLVNRQKIRTIAGREIENQLWERIANLNPTAIEWILVDERFAKEEVR